MSKAKLGETNFYGDVYEKLIQPFNKTIIVCCVSGVFYVAVLITSEDYKIRRRREVQTIIRMLSSMS